MACPSDALHASAASGRRANVLKMLEQSLHKSLDAKSEYSRNEELFDDHAGDRFH